MDCLIHDIIKNSIGTDGIYMSAEVEAAMLELRQYLFKKVYTNPIAKGEEFRAQKLIARLYRFYQDDPERLPEQYMEKILQGSKPDRIICDYIAGMTDQYAIAKFQEFFIPKAWTVS